MLTVAVLPAPLRAARLACGSAVVIAIEVWAKKTDYDYDYDNDSGNR